MSAPNSERVTESGHRDSASSPHGMQGPSFALLGSQEIHSRIQDWSNDGSTPGPNFAVQAYSCPGDPASLPRRLPAIQSSMALTMQSMSSHDSSFTGSMPSLSSGSSSRSDSSLRSSAASVAVRPGPLDDDGYYADSTASEIQINDTSNPVSKQSKGVPCLFGFLNCDETFTNVGRWNEHSKSHFGGKAPPRQLSCPYSSCSWTTSRRDGEDAWNQRWEHFGQKHDDLSHSEGLCEKPDVPLFKYLWNVGIITDAELQELRQAGRLGSDHTPFVVTEKPDKHRQRRTGPRR